MASSSGERWTILLGILAILMVPELLPGIVAAGSGDRMSFYVGRPDIETVASGSMECTAAKCPEAVVYKIGPDYFAGLGVHLVEGRELTEEDVRHGGRALVSANLAAELWPGAAATGRHLRLPRTNAVVEIVEGAGHFVDMEKPDELARL